jgi:hypothetical protein
MVDGIGMRAVHHVFSGALSLGTVLRLTRNGSIMRM